MILNLRLRLCRVRDKGQREGKKSPPGRPGTGETRRDQEGLHGGKEGQGAGKDEDSSES